ncbi:cytochrome d ubiquinol oxidase subunit II [Halalkalibacter oceani]|uniref:cytochrome d ubiquinol oxidase subunit II n=1 Tax=Halalkalibacter oceani TaxID=1653776 RepID=UPI0033911F63
MENIDIAILIMWFIFFIYAIAGSIDFGTGFYAMYYQRKGNDEATTLANNYLSPAWKVTNVFLVLLVVSFVGFFPGAAPSLGTLMIVPFCLVLLLLTIRSAFMVFAYSTERFSGLLTLVSGISGLLIPAILVSIIPAALGGFFTYSGNLQYILINQLFSSPAFYSHIAFAIVTQLFIAALFMSDYAKEGGRVRTHDVYRRNAIFLGPLTLVFAIITILTLIPEARWMFDKFLDLWWIYTLSLIAFAIGYSALWWPSKRVDIGQSRFAFIFIIIQFGLATIAYGSAILPYFLYPDLTIYDAFTNELMFRFLLIGFIIGMSILIPVFIWFWRLFLKDKKYITASEHD